MGVVRATRCIVEEAVRRGVGATGTTQGGVEEAAWGVRGAVGGIQEEVEEGARVVVMVEGEGGAAGAGEVEFCLALRVSLIWVVSERLDVSSTSLRH